jgi:tetratricopeptide (TPR) repeat protein
MAEILEQLHAKNPSAIAHKLAIHFDEGRLAARAYEFSLAGAERARGMYAHRDAVELIRRALRNAQDDAQKLEALELLGETSHFVGHYPDAVQAYTEALDLARAKADGKREIRLRRKIVHVERDRGGSRPERVEIEWTALAERAREIGADVELCEILWLLNGLPAAQGSTNAIERAREALAICERAGDRARLAQAHASLARAIAFGPDGMEARPHVEAGLRLFEEIGDRFRIGFCYNLLGILHAMAADYRTASEAFRSAAEAFGEVGAPSHEAGVRNNLGVILTRFGDLDQAEENLREAIRLNVRLDATATLLHPLENLAELFQTAERWTDARAQWKALLDVAHEAGYWNAEVIALCGNGVAALAQGEIETARGDEAAARAILADHQSWSEARAAYHYLSARIADAMGERDGAMHFLSAAEEELASRDRYTWATFRLLRAEMLAASAPADAASLARDVLAVFEQIGSGRMRERALALVQTPSTPGEP